MYIDAQNLLSDAQAFTASAASTNIIKLPSTSGFGVGEPMAVVFNIDVAADATTGNEAYTIALQSSSDSAFSSPVTHGSVVVAAGSGAVTFAQGEKFVLPVPPDSSVLEYLRLYGTLAGTTPTVTITAFLTMQSMVQNNYVYPRGYTHTLS
jgi:hypothetical protein